MAVENKKYGKPVYNHAGYKIVPILKTNVSEKSKVGNTGFVTRTAKTISKGYSGEYAILAGKKEVEKSKDIIYLKEFIDLMYKDVVEKYVFINKNGKIAKLRNKNMFAIFINGVKTSQSPNLDTLRNKLR